MNMDSKRVGSAAGAYGYAQMAIGAACTALATLGAHPAAAALSVMLGATLLSVVCFAFAIAQEP
jgi:DHA1 family bicyclomycin/chloramphenicol resistance-like MFS transporter